MGKPRKIEITTGKAREKLFDEVIDHLQRYNDAEKKWIADEAGVHWGTLYNWCAYSTYSPHLRTIAAVARALGYEIVLKRQHAAPPKLKLVKGRK